MFRNRGGQQPGNSKDCAEDIKKWWENCPYFYKFIFVTSTSFYLASWVGFLGTLLQYMFLQVPFATVTHFRFWTVATTFMLPRDFFDWLIGVYLVYHDGKRIEYKLGTVHYCLEFIFKNSMIQVLYITAMYLFQFTMGGRFTSMPSQGLFPTFMLFLALRGLAEPEQERPFMCFPVMVKNKWYVWILYGLIALISQSLVPDLLSAIGVAYLEVYVFKGQILNVSNQTLHKLENSCFFKKASARSDFITVDGAGGDPFSMQLPQQSPQQESQPQPTQSAFAGRGVSIGGGGGGQPIMSQQPQMHVINPSSKGDSDPAQAEIRRAAAQAALNRFEKEETGLDGMDEDQGQSQPNQKESQKTKKGYGQLNEEKEEDLI